MCDTFVALPPVTPDGAVVFGKNSDREPNEAQILEYYPPEHRAPGSSIQCTYTTVPAAGESRAVLLSRPFWMWGAEMGANDKGVVIGNEAVFTKMPYNKKTGLTGMDLLRLALERSSSAEQALETIVQLLSDVGQGGICGYLDKRFIYHNSFIIADPGGAWVLETAGHLWAALKVQHSYAISNGLTIGDEYDRSHPDLIDTARKKGWLKKGDTFNFAKTYSAWLFTTFSACSKRRNRSTALLKNHSGRLGIEAAIAMLRDHHSGDYRPDTHFLTSHLCVHAANGLTRNSGTTGSMVAHLTPEIQTLWATGTAAPCISVFKPIRFEGKVLPTVGQEPGGLYNDQAYWWRHEYLHRLVLQDFQSRSNRILPERDSLQASLVQRLNDFSGRDICRLTRDAFYETGDRTEDWIEAVADRPVDSKVKSGFQRYWKKQNRLAGLDQYSHF